MTTTFAVEAESRAGETNDMVYCLAARILNAFSNESADEYQSLLPSVSELRALMDQNKSLYGDFLSEVQAELARSFVLEALAKVKETFKCIVAVGKQKGIDWRSVRLVEAEIVRSTINDAVGVLVLAFISGGKQHTLFVNRVLIGHEIRATPFVRLS
jgi:hypothetical protein